MDEEGRGFEPRRCLYRTFVFSFVVSENSVEDRMEEFRLEFAVEDRMEEFRLEFAVFRGIF